MKGRGRSSKPYVEMLLEKFRPQQVDGRGWERAGEQECGHIRPERLLGVATCLWGASSLLWQQGAFAGWARAAPLVEIWESHPDEDSCVPV